MAHAVASTLTVSGQLSLTLVNATCWGTILHQPIQGRLVVCWRISWICSPLRTIISLHSSHRMFAVQTNHFVGNSVIYSLRKLGQMLYSVLRSWSFVTSILYRTTRIFCNMFKGLGRQKCQSPLECYRPKCNIGVNNSVLDTKECVVQWSTKIVNGLGYVGLLWYSLKYGVMYRRECTLVQCRVQWI